MYKPNEFITVDEPPFPSKGHTKVRQQSPSKPAKFDNKIFLTCDAANANFMPINHQIGNVNSILERE